MGAGGGGVLELLPDSSYLEFMLLDAYSSTNCFHTREVLRSTPVASSKGGPQGVWDELAAEAEGVRGGRDNGGADGVPLEDTFLPQPFQRVCGSMLPYLPFTRGVAGWLGACSSSQP